MAMEHRTKGAGYTSVLPGVPITQQRPPPKDLDDYLKNPGAPRANMVVDKEHPNGITTPPNDATVLQQHMAFWDPDNDSVVWPGDTYRGFRQLGFDPFLSFVAMPIIHGTFAYWSSPSWLPDPFFRIHLRNAHKTKHGSDSETYDTEGRFVPEKFEEIWSKYDKGNKGGLTLKEISQMVQGNRNIGDPMGWAAEWLEWNVSFYLAAKETPHGKMLLKEDALAIFDGSIFPRLANEIKAGRLKRTSMFRAGLSPTRPKAVIKPSAEKGQPLSERTRKEE